MHTVLSTILLVASLTPSKTWFPPDQPVTINVKPGGVEATLVLTDFSGKILAPTGPAEVAEDRAVNLRDVYQQLSFPGTYVLYLTKKGATKEEAYGPADFIGTPLVVNVLHDTNRGARPVPIVTRVEPLRYAAVQTPHGPISMVFYYDTAPHTVRNFLTLAGEGFYDGLTFHRIVPGFVLQTGDPLGTSSGGPGYTIAAEFSGRQHREGVLSMARAGDPQEQQGQPPRKEFADSASSQFFICLDYAATKQLDGKYTAFGEVASGMETVKKIAAVPIADAKTGQPKERQVIEKVEVKPVTAADNPYAILFKPVTPAAAPAK